MSRALLAALVSLLLLAAAQPSSALQGKKKDEVCPWCHNDPKVLAAAGLVSHGPIDIGPKGSADLAATSPATNWIFLESAHIRWAFSLGYESVEQKDKERVEKELARLRLLLPDVPAKVKKLDPYLRLHLLAMRGEELYARFQQLLRVTDADFPESRTAGKPYMGNGRFLGEKEKFEVVIHVTRASHQQFTTSFTGITVTDSLRWHYPSLHKLLVSVPAEDPDLRQNRWLFGHVAHNLSHLFLCAYKHFSYEPPIWLDEGLAHAMEKECEPESNTTDGEEGSMRDTTQAPDWGVAAKKMLAQQKQRKLAELLHIKEFGEMDANTNLTAWSMVRFLIDKHGDAFAKFLGDIKGQLDEKGYPTGANLQDLERKLLKELWGFSPADFDEAWKAWLAAQE
jgi:hypothetical protein